MFINSRSIAKICDKYPTEIISDTTEINSSDYEDIKEGNIVYVITSALSNFLKLGISVPIILVTGASVLGPYAVLGNSVYKLPIIRWYAQNCDFNNPRVYPIPLGLDFHSKPETQELLNTMIVPSPYTRNPRVYANFQFKLFKEHNRDRYIAIEELRKHPWIDWENKRTDQVTCWKRMGSYSFVLCPFGKGMDTHRIWEALVLGCIPIVRSGILSSLYSNLPVIQIDSWKSLNYNYLIKKRQWILSNLDKFQWNKLHMDYWEKIIKYNHI